MDRIERCFSALQQNGRKALVAYLCIGDPSLDESAGLARAALDAGADILELGVPFSDPTADGPSIARASQRAIAAGATLEQVIDVAARIRAASDAPLVLFSYYNPVLVTGEARVIERSAAAGIDGLLLVDLPPEEGAGLRRAAAAHGLSIIPLVAPTSDPARLRVIRSATEPPPGAARGFVYFVSMTGVTGAVATQLADASRTAQDLREQFGRPVVVGFGIDSAANARIAAGPRGHGADGIVVGTAIVKQIEQGGTPEERLANVRRFVSELREGLDGCH